MSEQGARLQPSVLEWRLAKRRSTSSSTVLLEPMMTVIVLLALYLLWVGCKAFAGLLD